MEHGTKFGHHSEENHEVAFDISQSAVMLHSSVCARMHACEPLSSAAIFVDLASRGLIQPFAVVAKVCCGWNEIQGFRI